MDKNPKVLIVDDEVSIRQLTRRILEKEDFEVFEAASGDDALIMLEYAYLLSSSIALRITTDNVLICLGLAKDKLFGKAME